MIDKHNTFARFQGMTVILGTTNEYGAWVRWFNSRSWFYCKFSELSEF